MIIFIIPIISSNIVIISITITTVDIKNPA